MGVDVTGFQRDLITYNMLKRRKPVLIILKLYYMIYTGFLH